MSSIASKIEVNRSTVSKLAEAVIRAEAESVLKLLDRIDDQFAIACELMLECKGRVVVIGMGKSGHIGGKIAATLASTGTPAFFVHPGEASHGDLGMITPNDVVLALSNSGNTDEILLILPMLKRFKIPMIALTGDPDSPLARNATVHIDVSVAQEACPLDLAPTSSTTVALVMGDALAIALLEWKGFTEEDYALSHPGGALGRKLLIHIADVMHSGAEVPRVQSGVTIAEALMEISSKGLGMTAVVDADGTLLGVFTDGDLRRLLDAKIDITTTVVDDAMTKDCKTITADRLAAEAAGIMDDHKINSLLVLDEKRNLIGALNVHDLLRARVL